MIKDLKDGDRVYGRFLINDCKKCVSGKGKNYLTLVLQDKTGTVDAKKWDVEEGDEELFARGKVVEVTADALMYNKALQLKVHTGEKVDPSSVKWNDLLISAPRSAEELEAKLNAYVDSIADSDLQKLVKKVIEKSEGKFLSWPGAVRNHHEFVNGLLFHSLTIADLAIKVCEVYPSLNRDVVLSGTLIHDIGKTVELSGPQACAFTLEGKLLGHISLGFGIVKEAATELGFYAFDDLTEEEKTPSHPLYAKKELAVIMEHIMLSHHGKQEFGSPVLPLTRESLIVSMIDDIDAKMMILDKAYADVAPGDSTAKIFSMDERYFYKPTYVKENTSPSGLSLDEELKAIKG